MTTEKQNLERLHQKHRELKEQHASVRDYIQWAAQDCLNADSLLLKKQREQKLRELEKDCDEIEQKLSDCEYKISQCRSNNIYNELIKLDCIEHIRKFAKFVSSSHPSAAFVIHGYSKYGLRLLIKRMLQEISASPLPIYWTSTQRRSSAATYPSMTGFDLTPLWGDLSSRLGCRPLPEQVALKISQKLERENVAIILDRTDITCDFSAIIDDFWSNLIQTVRNGSGDSANRLLFMILVEDSNYLNTCSFHFAEDYDDSWHPHIPVKLPCIDKYCAEDLNAWMNHASGIFSLKKRYKPGIIDDILENTQNGLSDHVIQYICTDLCECEFDEGMLLKWLNY